MSSEKRHFQHVVATERIVGIRDIILAETYRHAFCQKFLHSRMKRSRVGVAHNGHPCLLEQSDDLLKIRLRVQSHGPGMMRERASLPAAPNSLYSHRFQ